MALVRVRDAQGCKPWQLNAGSYLHVEILWIRVKVRVTDAWSARLRRRTLKNESTCSLTKLGDFGLSFRTYGVFSDLKIGDFSSGFACAQQFAGTSNIYVLALQVPGPGCTRFTSLRLNRKGTLLLASSLDRYARLFTVDLPERKAGAPHSLSVAEAEQKIQAFQKVSQVNDSLDHAQCGSRAP